MAIFWTLITVLPVVAFAACRFVCREKALAWSGMLDGIRHSASFFAQTEELMRGLAAWALSTFAWFWTAYECDTINIDVFDSLLFKRQTGGVFVYVLAAVLLVLTNLWMKKHLPVRALSGLFMLFPALAMKTTRLLVPAPGEFAPVQLLVLLLYLYAVCGMFGMFYPWHLENLVRRFFGGRPVSVKQEK